MMELIISNLPKIQAVLAILLVALILVQRSEDSLGGVFGGGGGDEMGVKNTRRGGEKRIFQITIVIAVLFVLLTLLSALIG